MRIRDWLSAGVVGLFIGGCAGMQTGASSETKAAVAPTGKLRVAFLSALIYVVTTHLFPPRGGCDVDRIGVCWGALAPPLEERRQCRSYEPSSIG
jgi:hypothetical protein